MRQPSSTRCSYFVSFIAKTSYIRSSQGTVSSSTTTCLVSLDIRSITLISFSTETQKKPKRAPLSHHALLVRIWYKFIALHHGSRFSSPYTRAYAIFRFLCRKKQIQDSQVSSLLSFTPTLCGARKLCSCSDSVSGIQISQNLAESEFAWCLDLSDQST